MTAVFGGCVTFEEMLVGTVVSKMLVDVKVLSNVLVKTVSWPLT